MLVLVVLAAAIYVSLVSVNGEKYPDPKNNYYSQLLEKEDALYADYKSSGASSKNRDLALTLWQNSKFEKAATKLGELAQASRTKRTSIYDHTFEEDLLNLGAIYNDMGAFSRSEQVYSELLAYDKHYLSAQDPKIGRDFNNIGLCYFMAAESESDPVQRKNVLNGALYNYQKAVPFLSRTPESRAQLAFNLQNQYLALSELGEDDRALVIEQTSASILSQLQDQSADKKKGSSDGSLKNIGS